MRHNHFTNWSFSGLHRYVVVVAAGGHDWGGRCRFADRLLEAGPGQVAHAEAEEAEGDGPMVLRVIGIAEHQLEDNNHEEGWHRPIIVGGKLRVDHSISARWHV